MFELLKEFLTTYHTKDEVLEYLLSNGYKISERQFRRECKQIKEDFINGVRDYTIASDPNNGYIVTKDPALILRSRNDYIARGIDCFKMARGIDKQLGYQDMIYLFADNKIGLDDIIAAFGNEK